LHHDRTWQGSPLSLCLQIQRECRRKVDPKRRELEGFLKEKKGRETERERPTIFFKREMRDRKREKLNREEKAGNNRREILHKRGGCFGEDRGEKGKPSKKRGRTGSDRGRKKLPEKKNYHSCHHASSPPP